MASGKHDDELSLIPDERIDDTKKGSTSRNRVQEPASKRKRYFIILCILFVELCERLAFYGVTVNLVFYCKDVLKLASPLPSTITLAFQGTGGIKANVSPMGADQLQDEGPEMVRKFFDWFYWFIMVGSLLASTVVAYVQQEVSFFYGFLITSVSIVCATILLVIGRRHYILHLPQGSYLTDTLRIIRGGLRDKLRCKTNPSLTHWLDGAKDSVGGRFPEEMVEGVKSVVRLIPIFLTFIFYWAVFGQSLTTYLLQGSNMNLKITEKLSFPAASLSLFEIVSLLILIPFIDRVVYPGLLRIGFNFTPLRRIGVGMLFAAGSVAFAGIIEIERKRGYNRFEQDVFNKTVNASTMSVFYQVPQYILQGTSEALVSVTGFEFAYSQSPADLRGVVMGLCLAMIGLGYYVAGLLASIVKNASHSKWYPDDLNDGTLEDYMFLLAGLMLINAAVFLCLAVRYRYADHAHQKTPVTINHDDRERTRNKGEPNL